MQVQPISNTTGFKGHYIYDYNLSINQMRNFRLALKNVDIYDKKYDIRIFNDISKDNLCKSGEHFVCVRVENNDKQKNIFINPKEQRKLKIIHAKVLQVAKEYDDKYNTLWGKMKNLFSI